MSFYRQLTPLTFQEKTLVIPVVSTANVSQLTADLLIATLGLKRAGIFDPKALVPVVGAADDGSEGISSALELFGSEEVNISVIQQRSPVIKSLKQEWVDELLKFISQSGFASVILLAGVDSTNRSDALMATPIYQVPLRNSANRVAALAALPIPELPNVSQDLPPDVGASQNGIPVIPGGGLTRRILSSVDKDTAWSIPIAAIVQYVLEGDNRGDAHLLATIVGKVLGVDDCAKDGWKEPQSWRQGLFGTGHDNTLYG